MVEGNDGQSGGATRHRAPNSNAYLERFNRTPREEALDHFIFLKEGHVKRGCREYVDFYTGLDPPGLLRSLRGRWIFNTTAQPPRSLR